MTSRAALMTPPGQGAIAVIRIVGSECLSLLKKIFLPQSPNLNSGIPPARLILGSICDDQSEQQKIDQVIVTYNDQHQSVDINCHGGARIVQRILMLLEKHQVQIVSWQDLTRSSCLAGEIENVLPEILTRTGVLALAGQFPSGLFAWAQKSIAILQQTPEALSTIKDEIQTLLPTLDQVQKLISPSRVVLTGPANVGKSTLANALTGKMQSITSDMAGTTRDWTLNLTDIGGFPINLIDTAGRHENNDYLQQRSLEQSDIQISSAELIILIVEANGYEEEQIEQQLSHLEPKINPMIVINKCDLTPPAPTNPNYLHISALTGLNLDQLRSAIITHLGLADFNPCSPLVFTHRQYDILKSAQQASDHDRVVEQLQELMGQ